MTLINKFDLLQSFVSGVETRKQKRNHATNGVNNLTLAALTSHFVGCRVACRNTIPVREILQAFSFVNVSTHPINSR